MISIVGRIVAIVVCGVIGAIAAWWFVGWMALDGVYGALAGVGAGMVIAAAAFVGWTTLGRNLERTK